MQPSGITRAAEIAYVVLILAVAGIVWREASTLPPAPYDPLGTQDVPDLGQLRAGGARPRHAGAAPVRPLARPRRAEHGASGLEDVTRRARAATLGRGPHAGPRVRLCGGAELPRRRLPARDRGLSVPVRGRARPARRAGA